MLHLAYETVIPPKSGLAVEVRQGQHLRVVQVRGKQVVDMVAWNLDNLREKLSTAYSRIRYMAEPGAPYFPHDTVTEGDWLMSGLCRPMMTIVRETVEPKGAHGLHHRMCNRFFYAVFGGEARDGCFENISGVVAKYGLLPEDVPDSIDLFMNYPHNCEKGHFTILEPIAKPGDYIEFRAEMNLLVAMSNCPEDFVTECNAHESKPVGVEIHDDDSFEPKPILPPYEWLQDQLKARGRSVPQGGATQSA